MPGSFRLNALLVLVGLASAQNALAQAIEQPPYSAVFGAASREASPKQILGLSLGVQQALGEDDSAVRLVPSGSEASGVYTGFAVNGRYDWRGKTAQFGVTGGTWLRYYGSEGQLVTESRQAVATFSKKFGRSTDFAVSQSMTYTPAYFYGLLGDSTQVNGAADPTTSLNLLNQEDRSLMRMTSVSLTKNVMRRGVMSVSSTLGLMDGDGPGVDRRSLTSYDVGGSFKYGLNREVALVLGYRYSAADYADGSRPVTHNIDLGIDYRKSLSFSRRTTFTTTVGSAIVSGPTGGPATGVPAAADSQFQVRGSGELIHQLSRTWRLTGVYRREVGYAQELRTPVLTNGWSASIDGFSGRRVDMSAMVSYAAGESAFTSSDAFKNYVGTGRARIAMSHNLAATVTYQYYVHNFARTADVALGIPRNLNSQSLRAGLSVWIPVRQR